MSRNVFHFGSGYRVFSSYWWASRLRWWTWVKPFVYSYQRVTRGWADCDTWSLDNHIAGVLADAIQHLRIHTHGYPNGLSEKKWDAILVDITAGFDAVQIMDEMEPEYTEDQTQEGLFGGPKRIYDWDKYNGLKAEHKKVFDKGMKLFHKYFFDLWD
jgi:hypothetical protein